MAWPSNCSPLALKPMQNNIAYGICIAFWRRSMGPGDHHESDRSHFLGSMFDRAIEEQRAGKTEFPVWGDPNAVREVLYVEDQISAILAADDSFENQIVNCAANAPMTIGEAARAICEVLDWRAPIVSPPSTFPGNPI